MNGNRPHKNALALGVVELGPLLVRELGGARVQLLQDFPILAREFVLLAFDHQNEVLLQQVSELVDARICTLSVCVHTPFEYEPPSGCIRPTCDVVEIQSVDLGAKL